MIPPKPQYAKNGDVYIAFSTCGDAPIDLIWCGGFATHLENAWEFPPLARMKSRIAGFSRLIDFDKRGVGLSDRKSAVASLEVHMDDIRAVLDAAGSKRAVLFGLSEGVPAALLFAATFPERVSALVLIGGFASLLRDESQPWAFTRDGLEAFREATIAAWGTSAGVEHYAQSAKDDPIYKTWWEKQTRLAASPGAVADMMALYPDIDVRSALPLVQARTLVIHAKGDTAVPVQASRLIAAKVPNARLIELDSNDHAPWLGDQDRIIEEIETFLTGQHSTPVQERTLSTVLYTDIVGSTTRAATVGDDKWNEIMREHNDIARREIERGRGRLIKTLGDGVLATFDGPARAIRCAASIRSALGTLGVPIRAGLHTGEVAFDSQDISGMAVNIAARVVQLAESGEVLTSSTVRDLVIGSGLEFEDRGIHALKGVPGSWTLCAVRV